MQRKISKVLIWGGVLLTMTGCGALFNRSKIDYSKLKAFHQGWSGVQALGGRQPVSQATGLATTSPTVTLSWNPMSFPYASIDSYNLYRSSTSGGQDFTKPLATGIATSALTYTDTTASTSTTYYYTVRPVVAGYALATTEADTEIKVMVPPTNMALVHRWMANLEMCSNLMGRSYDRANNYRCKYTGPINTNGYYDYGHNQFWDVVEMGCNYTPPNSNPALSCGDSTNGCLGLINPNGSITGGVGQVFYNRASSLCYVWSSGTTWVAASAVSVGQLGQMASNQPGLPPFVRINQSQGAKTCQQFSVNSLGVKSLPKHSEHIVAAAWSSSLNDTEVSSLENGLNLPMTGGCNSNYGSGLTFDSNTTPSDLETLPGTTSSSKAVRTGSNATKNCVSRYGIQDIAGNNWKWNSDQLGDCTSGVSCFSTGPSSIDSANMDWWYSGTPFPIHFDGTIGPGGTAAATIWTLSDLSFNTTAFLAPIGLPLVQSISSVYDSQAIGTGKNQFNPSNLHGNIFGLAPGNGNSIRGALAGGAFDNNSGAGRFAFTMSQAPTSTNSNWSIRCKINAD